MMKFTSTLAVLVLAVALLAMPASAQEPDLAYDVLSTDTQDPTQMQVAADGRIIWGERKGGVNVLLPDGTQIDAGTLPVSAHQCAECAPANGETQLDEGGLMGLLLTQDFATSNRIYLYWSVRESYDAETKSGEWRLATYVLDPVTNTLDMDSEEVLWTTRTEWNQGHHYGGNLEWMPDGTILLSMGDDTRFPSSGGYGPRDHRQDYDNAEVTSQNPANHRGKVLRLRADGTVPDGSRPGEVANPFIGQSMDNPYICLSQTLDMGGPGNWDRYNDTCPDADYPSIDYDPYIYSMGWKQPWRGVVFPDGSAVYGDVGPDASADDPHKGPRGHEEINVIPSGGGDNHGWPRCTANNIPYGDINWGAPLSNTPGFFGVGGVVAEATKGTQFGYYHGPLDCDGFSESLFWYTNSASQWPAVGTGGKTSEPVAVYTADIDGPLALPDRFDDTMIMMEFSRDRVMAIPFDPDTHELRAYDEAGNPSDAGWQVVAKPGGGAWLNPLDAVIGPDGALYTMEYGTTYWNNGASQIGRIRCAGCTGGNSYGLSFASGSPAATAGPTNPTVVVLVISGLLGLAVLSRRRDHSVA